MEFDSLGLQMQAEETPHIRGCCGQANEIIATAVELSGNGQIGSRPVLQSAQRSKPVFIDKLLQRDLLRMNHLYNFKPV